MSTGPGAVLGSIIVLPPVLAVVLWWAARCTVQDARARRALPRALLARMDAVRRANASKLSILRSAQFTGGAINAVGITYGFLVLNVNGLSSGHVAGMLLALIQLVGRSWAMTLGVLPSLSAVLMDLRPLVSTVAVVMHMLFVHVASLSGLNITYTYYSKLLYYAVVWALEDVPLRTLLPVQLLAVVLHGAVHTSTACSFGLTSSSQPGLATLPWSPLVCYGVLGVCVPALLSGWLLPFAGALSLPAGVHSLVSWAANLFAAGDMLLRTPPVTQALQRSLLLVPGTETATQHPMLHPIQVFLKALLARPLVSEAAAAQSCGNGVLDPGTAGVHAVCGETGAAPASSVQYGYGVREDVGLAYHAALLLMLASGALVSAMRLGPQQLVCEGEVTTGASNSSSGQQRSRMAVVTRPGSGSGQGVALTVETPRGLCRLLVLAHKSPAASTALALLRALSRPRQYAIAAALVASTTQAAALTLLAGAALLQGAHVLQAAAPLALPLILACLVLQALGLVCIMAPGRSSSSPITSQGEAGPAAAAAGAAAAGGSGSAMPGSGPHGRGQGARSSGAQPYSTEGYTGGGSAALVHGSSSGRSPQSRAHSFRSGGPVTPAGALLSLRRSLAAELTHAQTQEQSPPPDMTAGSTAGSSTPGRRPMLSAMGAGADGLGLSTAQPRSDKTLGVSSDRSSLSGSLALSAYAYAAALGSSTGGLVQHAAAAAAPSGGAASPPDLRTRVEALATFKGFMHSLDALPAGTYSLQEFIAGAASAIQGVFPGACHASCCLLTSSHACVNMYTFLGDGARKPRVNVAVAPGTLIYHVLHACAPVFISDVAAHPGPYSDVQFMRFVLSLRSVACLPLVGASDSRVLGVLRLGFDHEWQWSEQEKSIAKQLALILTSTSTMGGPLPSATEHLAAAGAGHPGGSAGSGSGAATAVAYDVEGHAQQTVVPRGLAAISAAMGAGGAPSSIGHAGSGPGRRSGSIGYAGYVGAAGLQAGGADLSRPGSGVSSMSAAGLQQLPALAAAAGSNPGSTSRTQVHVRGALPRQPRKLGSLSRGIPGMGFAGDMPAPAMQGNDTSASGSSHAHVYMAGHWGPANSTPHGSITSASSAMQGTPPGTHAPPSHATSEREGVAQMLQHTSATHGQMQMQHMGQGHGCMDVPHAATSSHMDAQCCNSAASSMQLHDTQGQARKAGDGGSSTHYAMQVAHLQQQHVAQQAALAAQQAAQVHALVAAHAEDDTRSIGMLPGTPGGSGAYGAAAWDQRGDAQECIGTRGYVQEGAVHADVRLWGMDGSAWGDGSGGQSPGRIQHAWAATAATRASQSSQASEAASRAHHAYYDISGGQRQGLMQLRTASGSMSDSQFGHYSVEAGGVGGEGVGHDRSGSGAHGVPMNISMSRASIMQHVGGSGAHVPLGAAVHPAGVRDMSAGHAHAMYSVSAGMRGSTPGWSNDHAGMQVAQHQQAMAYGGMLSGALNSHAPQMQSQASMQSGLQYSPTVPMAKLQLSPAEYQAAQAAQAAQSHHHYGSQQLPSMLHQNQASMYGMMTDGSLAGYGSQATSNCSLPLGSHMDGYQPMGGLWQSMPGMAGSSSMIGSIPQGIIVSMGSMQSDVSASAQEITPEPPELQLQEVIGRGGFGSVYKAVWRGQQVAVKVLEHEDDMLPGQGGSGKQSVDTSSRRAALLEGAMTATISHPNVVHTFDYRVISLDPGVGSGNHSLNLGRPGRVVSHETHIIMEFCDRGSLQDAIDQGWFFVGGVKPSKQETAALAVGKKTRGGGGAGSGAGAAAVVAGSGKGAGAAAGSAGSGGGVRAERDMELIVMTLAEISAAMEYLHLHRITHRDLKPKNILLRSSHKDRRSFVAKVSDFGLSQVLPDNNQTQLSTKYSGTVTHMAPELIEDGKVYPQGDVYAFGVIMWEVFTGGAPYPNMAHPQIMVGVVTHNLRPKFPDYCPEWYKSLASKCWRKDPKSRPPFSEVSACLLAALADKAKGWLPVDPDA